MTPEERLSQIEALFATAAKYTTRHEAAIVRQEEAIARHEEAIARQEEVITRHEETLERLDNQVLDLNLKLAQTVEMFQELAAYQRQSQERMDRSQQEIQRIWEYLMGQSRNGHNS